MSKRFSCRMTRGLLSCGLLCGYLALLPLYVDGMQGAVIPVRDPKAPEGKPTTPGKSERLETEMVAIDRLSVFPRAIHRKPGRFALLLTNRTKDANAVFELVRQDGEGAPILRIGGKGSWVSMAQKAAAIDEAPGVLLLKAPTNGRVLCTITIAE